MGGGGGLAKSSVRGYLSDHLPGCHPHEATAGREGEKHSRTLGVSHGPEGSSGRFGAGFQMEQKVPITG